MRRTLPFCIKAVVLLGWLAASANFEPTFANTFVVTNVNDSGSGSLRQAILNSNATSVSPNMITFNIPSSNKDVYTITPLSPLPTIQVPVILDATTQPDYAGKPIVEIRGSRAGATAGLDISAGFSTIRGLVINRFNGTGISLRETSGNTVEDNYIGTDVSGTIDLGNTGPGIAIGFNTANHVIRRNVISGNGGDGISLSLGLFSLIEDNYIGTDASGTLALGNDKNGIKGGLETFNARRNVVSGNHQNGVDSGGNNLIQGNFIGTDKTGTQPIGNFGHGVRGVLDRVGGLNAGEGNIVAFNGGSGVVENGQANIPHEILSNSIFSNSSLGIDLNNDGVTLNDACDMDADTMGWQNYPVLASATITGANIVIVGTLDSKPNTDYLIQFFSSDACDPSGYGEGQRLIGSVTVTSGAGCIVSFSATFPATAVKGGIITATATRSGNITSEFSQCLTVTSSGN